MTELKSLPLDEEIRLRWILRDIRAKRFTLSPVAPADLDLLTQMGLVELQESGPILTAAGLDEV